MALEVGPIHNGFHRKINLQQFTSFSQSISLVSFIKKDLLITLTPATSCPLLMEAVAVK